MSRVDEDRQKEAERGRRIPRAFRYPTVPSDDRDRACLVRELVVCGKRSCRCARGLKHGPYWYLRYEEYDRLADTIRYRREYVPRGEVRRVRRWIRREQTNHLNYRAALSLLRRAASQQAARDRVLGRRRVVFCRFLSKPPHVLAGRRPPSPRRRRVDHPEYLTPPRSFDGHSRRSA